MKNWRFPIVLGSILCLNFVPQSARSVDKDSTCTRLTQSCKALKGPATIYLAPNGDMSMKNGSLMIILQPPKWDITVINAMGKIFFQSGFKLGLEKLTSATTTVSEQFSQTTGWTAQKGPMIAGFPTHEWSCKSDPAASRSKYWTLAEAGFVSPQCAQMLAAEYGLPCLQNELPLKFVFYSVKGIKVAMERHYEDSTGAAAHLEVWLDTTSAKKGLPTDKANFSIPKDCKKSGSFDKVFMNENLNPNNYIFKDLLKNPDALFNSR